MKLYKTICYCAVLVGLLSCSSKEVRKIPTLEVAANVDCADTGSLNDIFDLKAIVTPELTDTTLLSYSNVRGVYGGNIYIQEDNRMMIFNIADGTCVSSIDRTGSGPGDYTMLYFAYPSPDNGDWVAWDLRGHKIVRYNPDGTFVGATPTEIEGICPDGKNRWAGQKFVYEGDKQIIYLFDEKFTIIDSIETPLTRYFMTSNRLYPFNGQPSILASDTLYTVTPDNEFKPTIAFNLAKYKPPYYKENEFDKMLEERNNYIYQSFLGECKLAGIIYQFNGKRTLQFYSLLDNSLLFSFSAPKEEFFEGFPFTVNGITYQIVPLEQQPCDKMMFFRTVPDQEDMEEENPTIIILKLKPQYS